MTTRRSAAARRPRAGFTLVELVIVVMMLGVLAGVAAPRYQTALAGTHLRSSAKRLAADLRRARSVANNTAVDVAVVFDSGAETYTSTGLPDPDHPAADLMVDVSAKSHGVGIASADFDGAETVTFDFRGEPSATGAVTLSNGAATAVISVDELGEVEVTP